jgi:anti-sigma regulatory factor (Ser/Thr protein kinase)
MEAGSGPTHPEEFRLVLSPDVEAGWRARHALRQRFSRSLPALTLIDLVAVVTELVNNAVAKGPGRPITVALIVSEGVIRGEVADRGNPAATSELRQLGEAGLDGLEIVDKLTSRWAVYDGSTDIWFEIPLRG